MIVLKPFDKHQLLSALAVLLQRRSDPVVYPFRSPARAKP
jgi:hypothetical protein